MRDMLKDYYSPRVNGDFGDKEYFVLAEILNKLKLENPPERVLDIGCSHGGYALTLMKQTGAREAYGVDISKSAIEFAQKKGVRAFVVDLDEELLPFDNEFFDIILAMEIIEHLYNPDNMLQEVRRVLKKDGYFILTTPNLVSWMNRIAMLFGFQPYYSDASLKFVEGLLFNKKLRQPPTGHLRLYTLRAIKGLLEDHNFVVIDAFGRKKGLFSERIPRPVKFIDKAFSIFPSLSSDFAVYAKKK